jgi:hypothetical protein
MQKYEEYSENGTLFVFLTKSNLTGGEMRCLRHDDGKTVASRRDYVWKAWQWPRKDIGLEVIKHSYRGQ